MELDEELVPNDDDREVLQDIINNLKLSEGYLTLARDIEVMEPKSPEDIYKVSISSFSSGHFFFYFLLTLHKKGRGYSRRYFNRR